MTGTSELLVLFCFASILAPLQGAVIVDVAVISMPSGYSYDYSVENQMPTAVLGFAISAPAVIDSVSSPRGWDAVTLVVGSRTLIQWVSLDAASDIPAFGNLSNFVIRSDAAPGLVQFVVLDEIFSQTEGAVGGPVTIPEPSTTGSAILGLVATGLTIVGRRRDEGLSGLLARISLKCHLFLKNTVVQIGTGRRLSNQ